MPSYLGFPLKTSGSSVTLLVVSYLKLHDCFISQAPKILHGKGKFLVIWLPGLAVNRVAPPPPAADPNKGPSPLGIPGLRDEAVKEYSEWQVSNVTNDTLRASFRQVCDVIIENGLDLEQVYKDQDPSFFIGKGIKIGIARRFVEDIRCWVENVKRVIPIYELD